MNWLSTKTPIGNVTIWADETAIKRVSWGWSDDGKDLPLLTIAVAQLHEYFAGSRKNFDLPLAPDGSEFQVAVCSAMSAIPFGDTRTYGEIADELGAPPQAVGQACGGNPIPIIIPCHRVLSASGLGGFSARGGVETKVALLKHEGAASLLI